MLYLGRLNHPFSARFHSISTVRKTTSHKTNACKLSDWSQGTVEAVQTGRVQELDAIQHFPQQPTGFARGWLTPSGRALLHRDVSSVNHWIKRDIPWQGKLLDDQAVGCCMGLYCECKWAKLKTLSWSIRHDLHSLDIRSNNTTSSNLIIQMPSFQSKTDILIS